MTFGERKGGWSWRAAEGGGGGEPHTGVCYGFGEVQGELRGFWSVVGWGMGPGLEGWEGDVGEGMWDVGCIWSLRTSVSPGPTTELYRVGPGRHHDEVLWARIDQPIVLQAGSVPPENRRRDRGLGASFDITPRPARAPPTND